jgi:hypothetical protein
VDSQAVPPAAERSSERTDSGEDRTSCSSVFLWLSKPGIPRSPVSRGERPTRPGKFHSAASPKSGADNPDLCHPGRPSPWKRTAPLVVALYSLAGFSCSFVGNTLHSYIFLSLCGCGLICRRSLRIFGFVWHSVCSLFSESSQAACVCISRIEQPREAHGFGVPWPLFCCCECRPKSVRTFGRKSDVHFGGAHRRRVLLLRQSGKAAG